MGQWDNKMTKIEHKTQFRQVRQEKCPPDVPNQAPNYAREGIVPLSRSVRKAESEKTLEAKFRKEIEALGGMALKLLSQLHRGLPDRLVLMPGGLAFFAEIKTTGKRPTGLQKRCHAQLREMGFDVYVIDSTESMEKAVALINRAVIARRILKEELGV